MSKKVLKHGGIDNNVLLSLIPEMEKTFSDPITSFFNDFKNFYSDNSLLDMFGFNYEKVSFPRCDIKETEKSLEIIMELPSPTTKDNINIESKLLNYDFILLTVKVESNINTGTNKGEKCRYLLKQLKHSSFSRSFTLNSIYYDVDNIEANFENGLLYIIINKRMKEEKKDDTKKIKIK